MTKLVCYFTTFVTTLLCTALPAAAKVKVAASVPDLASLAASIGGAEAEVFSISRAGANPHSVEVLPSYMIKVARADLYLKVGLGLDGWADPVIEGSRNTRLAVVDCSRGIAVLGKPTGVADASLGDVHPEGNPHYWLDPANALIIAETVRDAFQKASPGHAALFAANCEAFKAENARRLAGWKDRLRPFLAAGAVPVLTYHDSWPYFARAFDLRIAGLIEPFPGIPPTAKHLQDLLQLIPKEGVAILIKEPYFPDKDARFLGRKAGVRILNFSPSCDGTLAGDYWTHFDRMTADLVEALAGAKGAAGSSPAGN